MKVLYDSVDHAFIFYDMDVATEHPTLKRELCNIMMHHEVMRTYYGRVDAIQDSVAFYTQDKFHERKAHHMGSTITLSFNNAEAAMAFKLAFIEGETFIPWNK